jgi:hypothetical protein
MSRAEEILLTAVYAEEVFRGTMVRQERPWCCGRQIDLYRTPVAFCDLQLGGRSFTLLEPICPRCGRRVQAIWSVVN